MNAQSTTLDLKLKHFCDASSIELSTTTTTYYLQIDILLQCEEVDNYFVIYKLEISCIDSDKLIANIPTFQ